MRLSRRVAAAAGLEEERDQIAGDEDSWVGEGLDAAVLGAEGYYYAGEGEVESCCQEGGGDGEADDLNEVWVLRRNVS